MVVNKLKPVASAEIVYFNTYFVVSDEAGRAKRKQPCREQPARLPIGTVLLTLFGRRRNHRCGGSATRSNIAAHSTEFETK
ncbi:hypothetical protein M3I54_02470 [Paraburkholderia sp. CNPSo 3274]|uniref:hypothetical protein n=1 Tax=Paraburkholderia sp. CNPSo 3274 TaxID=2940932 RepID=UPI0020B6DA01|nr:hypothetical protein [Paraburkholderia sp. CNPSo 3274]MCP3705862.1 hypothetical protein [Paraburkholderia sp. CNPSo 3274]